MGKPIGADRAKRGIQQDHVVQVGRRGIVFESCLRVRVQVINNGVQLFHIRVREPLGILLGERERPRQGVTRLFSIYCGVRLPRKPVMARESRGKQRREALLGCQTKAVEVFFALRRFPRHAASSPFTHSEANPISAQA